MRCTVNIEAGARFCYAAIKKALAIQAILVSCR
jgi:hypothetical protein